MSHNNVTPTYCIIRCTNIISPQGNQRLFVLTVSVRGFRIDSSEREHGGYQMTAEILLWEFPASWLLMSSQQKQLDSSHARHKKLGIMQIWFGATRRSHYIYDKRHSFAELWDILIECIFVSRTRGTLWCSNNCSHLWGLNLYIHPYNYIHCNDIEMCAESFGRESRATYTFSNANMHSVSSCCLCSLSVLVVCSTSSEALLKLISVRKLDDIFCLPC